MLLKRLIIVGYPTGHLAGAIHRHALKLEAANPGKFKVMFYHDRIKLSKKERAGTVVIYAGKGGQFAQTIHFCMKYCLPLIQAATGITKVPIISFPFVVAPNVAPPIVAFFETLKMLRKAYDPIWNKLKVRVIESHHKSKTTVPGTARKMAEILDYIMGPRDSIRDPKQQIALGIPKRHLGRHAFHRVRITGLNVKITLETKVFGVEAYGPGALWLAEQVLVKARNLDLRNRAYEVEEFLK